MAAPGERLRRALGAAFGGAMNLLEAPMRLAQRRLRAGRIGWVFVAPNLGVFGLFTFLPIAIDLVYAVTGGNQLFPAQRPYVGLDNFKALLSCKNYLDPNSCVRDLFWHGIYNTAEFVAVQVVFMIGLSLVTALALNRPGRARGFFRAVFFYPVLLSPVVVALIWKWVLQRYGVLNAALGGLGLATHDWLLNGATAFFWSVFVSIWAHMGFYTLILLAGLQAIPRDVYEAAAMDATPPWRRFRRITLPLLMPSLLVVLVLALIRAVQIFDEVYVLTKGGPGTSTTFLVQFIYQTGFAQQVREYGMAAAASLLLALVLMALTYLQLRVTRART
ncbi:MAG: carbohydrate ABC transporter permease [Acidobacteriota bacterium]